VSASLLEIADAFVAALADFEPRLFTPDQCMTLVEALARVEKSSGAARSRAAARAAACGAPRQKGFARPADWLARSAGCSTAQAEREIDTARKLDELPLAREAVNKGELSMEQASEIVATVEHCPDAEREMVEAARKESLRTLKEKGRQKRARAIGADELHARQRAVRFHRHWRDEMGMVRYSGAMTPDVGIPFINRLEAETDREWRAANREGRTASHEQLAADAFARTVSGEGKGHATRADVVYVCDITAGTAHIVGGGPVPLATVDAVARDAFIKAVLHDGEKIDTIVHYGRRQTPAVVRTAIELGEVPHFDGISCVDCGQPFLLQLDHDDPVANGGPTSARNLKPRCFRCHVEKTERDRLAGLLDRGRRATADDPP
jgi:hypothetical protein